MALLTIHNGQLAFGDHPLLDHADFALQENERVCLVGRNGAGKSTLMKIMAGVDTEVTGEHWAAEGVKVGYLPQEPRLNKDKDVWGNVIEGCEDKTIFDNYNAVAMKMAEEYNLRRTCAASPVCRSTSALMRTRLPGSLPISPHQQSGWGACCRTSR